MKQCRARLYAHVTPAEYEEVTALAKQLRLTTSALVRRLVTGRRLPDTKRDEDVLSLLKINADLARLGNLLRMALDDPEFTPPEGLNLEILFEDVRETQGILKEKIMTLS